MPVSPNMPPATDGFRHLTSSMRLRPGHALAACALCLAQASHAAGATPAPLETIPLLLGAALGVVLLRGLRD